MDGWARCTNRSGRTIFVNLAIAMSTFWNETEQCTIIAYVADNEPLRVKEHPAAILRAAGFDCDTAKSSESD